MELLSQLKETGWPPPVRSSWPSEGSCLRMQGANVSKAAAT